MAGAGAGGLVAGEDSESVWPTSGGWANASVGPCEGMAGTRESPEWVGSKPAGGADASVGLWGRGSTAPEICEAGRPFSSGCANADLWPVPRMGPAREVSADESLPPKMTNRRSTMAAGTATTPILIRRPIKTILSLNIVSIPADRNRRTGLSQAWSWRIPIRARLFR